MTRSTALFAGLAALVAFASTGGIASAGVAASANFELKTGVLNAGGGDMSSTNFKMTGAIGEWAVGNASSTNFSMAGGFIAGTLGGVAAIPVLVSVYSQKVHGAAGTYNVPIDIAQAIGGNVSVEPRAEGPSGHRIVFAFDRAITAQGTATSKDINNLAVGNVAVSSGANAVVVTLTGIPNATRVKLDLTGVNGSTAATAALGFLLGDVNNNRATNSTDVSAVRSRSGLITTQDNFRHDLNASGTVTAADVAAVKAKSGTQLP